VESLRRLRTYPWLLRLLWLGLIALPAGVAFLFFGVEISSRPAFCGSCHVMKPYYISWETSSHNDVACVECHIPPGIVPEIRKKYEALAMVVSYFTGTYGTNPWAEIPDESCLRPGCHEQRLLVGRELFKNVLFDHRPHLTEMRRKKRLRCTSCHSQIVQGQHITVTEGTCFLCHFKETPLGKGLASCTLCHETPEKIITVANLRFDHADVERFGMECTLCHKGVVQGKGEVPEDRCLSCHGEPERLARLGETDMLHRVHITDHKVECLSCHMEIRHRIPHEELLAAATRCETCHVGGGHSPQRDLYVGIGGKGVTPRPAAMYLAQVSCESCHLVTQEGKRLASEVSCMACHGAKFLRVYQNWQEVLSARLKRVQSQSRKVTALIPEGSEPLRRALENLAFVEEGRAIHNPGYALEILWKAYEDLNLALKDAGIEERLPPPWTKLPYETRCSACHLGAEGLMARVDRRIFRHEAHTVRASLRCTSCHQDVNHREPAHGDQILSCSGCHPTSEELAEAKPKDCLRCHIAEIPATSKVVRFSHERHIDLGFACTLCHEEVLRLDHLELTEAVPKLGHKFCGRCHGGNVPPQEEFNKCLKCHTNF